MSERNTIIPVSEETVERLISHQYAKFKYGDGSVVALIPEAYREMLFRSFSPEQLEAFFPDCGLVVSIDATEAATVKAGGTVRVGSDIRLTPDWYDTGTTTQTDS